ncbi:MAG TPA: cyclase family protein [Gemmataceae bacterium]|nr:cyclase family protein [Gemmataceae bacterium]
MGQVLIYDISPSINERLKVWPGDIPASREVLCDMQRGDNLTLSALRATVHLGAHADAPSHYGARAPAIDERDLRYYLGVCQVMHIAVQPGHRIMPADIKTPIAAPRVLLATGTYPDPEQFNEAFASLSPELIEHMHQAGVILIGIDTPSVDPFTSRDLPAHKTFLQHDMAILEGLILRDVPAGPYELIALPLKLVGFDASPVRAVLRTLAGKGGRRES